jgi:hypothetical protein
LRATSRLLAFCEQHDIPAFGAWPLLAPYALCDRVDRGSGVKLRALIEVLKRGIDVVYSDADVVWRRPFVPPRKPHGAPPYDIAFQSYSPLPDADTEALVQYGTNFGLFHARATKRAIGWLQRLLPRAASYFAFVTAPHWRTRQGMDQFRVYACNDQNALHAFLAENDTVCQYTFDRTVGAELVRQCAAKRDCAVIAMLSPTRYPTAMPFIYAQRDWHDANDSALVALHLTTYPGADKTHGARELRVWAADNDDDTLAAQRQMQFVALDPAAAGRRQLARERRAAPVGAADRVCTRVESHRDSARAAVQVASALRRRRRRRAKPTRERPFVLGRAACTVDLYLELTTMVEHGVQFRAHSFLEQLGNVSTSTLSLSRQRCVENDAAQSRHCTRWHCGSRRPVRRRWWCGTISIVSTCRRARRRAAAEHILQLEQQRRAVSQPIIRRRIRLTRPAESDANRLLPLAIRRSATARSPSKISIAAANR